MDLSLPCAAPKCTSTNQEVLHLTTAHTNDKQIRRSPHATTKTFVFQTVTYNMLPPQDQWHMK